MRFKKVIRKIHLWLGLASGIIIIILGVTGCILAFEHEIRAVTQPYWFTKEENKPLLPPHTLKTNAEKFLDGKEAASVEYGETGRSALVYYYAAGTFKIIFLNPYTGEVIKVKNMNRDFFRLVLDGHYYLWLPHKIGQFICASATLIFLVMLITGLILWWPKNKAAGQQRFIVKWNTSWKRTNYSLHNVSGFYMAWIALFIVITGLVWGFQWVEKSVYWISSGGKAMPAYYTPDSDTTLSTNRSTDVTTLTWQKMMQRKKPNERMSVSFPWSAKASLNIIINHSPTTHYNTESHFFDQYSGKELPGKGTYAGSFQSASIPDKIKRMNHDIHVGSVAGLPGKVLAFCISLIAASLPITGFYIWWDRRKISSAVDKQKSQATFS